MKAPTMTEPAETTDPIDENPDPTATPPETAEASAEPPLPAGPSTEELRLALKAFRKRLRLTRLDDESRMGYGPTSSGQKSRIVSITPPNQFPPAVWKELARQGKIKRDGGSLYSLVGE
jgi:hypothetical protein